LTLPSSKRAEKVNAHEMAVDIESGQFVSEVPGITYEVFKDLLIEELEYMKSKDKDKDTTLKVNSKEDVKEEIGRSPGFPDTAMMRAKCEYPVVKQRGFSINRPSFAGYNQC